MASAKTHGISISIPLSNDAWLAGWCVCMYVWLFLLRRKLRTLATVWWCIIMSSGRRVFICELVSRGHSINIYNLDGSSCDHFRVVASSLHTTLCTQRSTLIARTLLFNIVYCSHFTGGDFVSSIYFSLTLALLYILFTNSVCLSFSLCLYSLCCSILCLVFYVMFAYGTCGGDCMKGMRSRHIQTCFVVILKGVTLTNVQLSLHVRTCGLVVGIFALNENGKKYFVHKCLWVLCTLSYYLVKSLLKRFRISWYFNIAAKRFNR